jgi:predicted PurR-regulated permease PerM
MGKIFSFRDTNMEVKEEEKKGLEDLKEAVKYSEKTEKSKPVIIIQFSWEILALLVLVLALIFMSKQLISVVLFLFLGFVFLSAARPVVNWFMTKKLSRGAAVAVTYLIAILIILSLLSIVIFPLAGQLSELAKAIPTWVTNFSNNFKGFTFGNITIDPQAVTNFVSNSVQSLSSGDSIKSFTTAVSGVFSTTGLLVSSLILSIYLVLEHDSLLDFGLIRIISDEKRERVKKLVLDVERKLGRWLLGQATISTITGIFVGIVLTILKVPFALPLAVMVALFDAIPGIGATIAIILTALAVLVTVGPIKVLILIAVFLVYQQFENNFIVPKVMGNAIGLKPVIIMLGVFIFFILFGVPGALMAVPIIVILQIFYEFYIDLQKLKAKGIV